MKLRELSVLQAGWGALLLCLSTTALFAQRQPHIGYVYPAGGQQGRTFEVVVGGQYLTGTSEALVSGAGVTVRVIGYDRPIQQKRINEMREKLQGVREEMTQARKQGQVKNPAEAMKLFVRLIEAEGITVDELKKAAEDRRQKTDPKRQLNPQLAETVTLKVTVAPDAEPGPRELRLGSRAGLSNPLAFCVGQLPEVLEPDNEPEYTWELLSGAGRWSKTSEGASQPLKPVKLPAVLNGQILPGEVDEFRFTARKGQQLVAAVSARALIPYLADAVPGWFQATVGLYDSKGNELAYDDDFQFHPDPVLYYVIPKDGDYSLKIKDSIYRGREDFVYRIALGELPFITGIFPLGGRAGEKTQVELMGWNLPVKELVVQPNATDSDVTEITVAKEGHVSNPVRFALGSLPELIEREPNNVSANAQPVSLPLVINGRIGEPGDWDVFRIEGRAGEEIVAEMFARRLGSPLDSVLKLTDATGRELASNDDHRDESAGLTTHHADSRIYTTLPADGVYYVQLGDTQRQGGSAYAYRLQITPPTADFKLRIVPSSVSLRAGASVPFTVHVLRAEGFTNDIQLALSDAPPGFSLGNTRLTAATNQFKVTLKATSAARQQTCCLEMEGRADVDGRQVVRTAVPADDLMQAFIYRHLVPAQEFQVAVTGRISPPKPAAKPTKSQPGKSRPVAVK